MSIPVSETTSFKQIPELSGGRKWFFRALMLLVVLSPLVLIELGVRILLPVPPVVEEDPFVSFQGVEPLFTCTDAGIYETSSSRLTYFQPQSFPAQKRARALRIFCLGGSTVQGRPYAVETSFSSWLGLNLQAAFPDRDIEVVNCGGISYASYRLVPILREVLDYQPDVIILCTGQNEFLEDRTYGRLKRVPGPLIQLHRGLLGLRSYAWLDHWLGRKRRQASVRTVLPAEVEAMLDSPEGLSTYHRDSDWRTGVMHHFEQNLHTLLDMTRDAGVPVVLMNPVVNLKDCPPFKSEPTPGLTDAQRRQVQGWRDQARDIPWTDAHQKAVLLEKAAALDSQNAELLYLVGCCHYRLARMEAARLWFEAAWEADICPLRILKPMQDMIVAAAKQRQVPWVNMQQLFVERSPDGIVGAEWLMDHVHPRVEGHQLLADELMQVLMDEHLIEAPDDWSARRESLWQAHLDSLEEVYFAQGARRLKRVQRWSRGLHDDLPPPEPHH